MIKFWYDTSNHCMTISLGLLFLGIFSSESHFLDIVFSIFETISHICSCGIRGFRNSVLLLLWFESCFKLVFKLETTIFYLYFALQRCSVVAKPSLKDSL